MLPDKWLRRTCSKLVPSRSTTIMPEAVQGSHYKPLKWTYRQVRCMHCLTTVPKYPLSLGKRLARSTQLIIYSYKVTSHILLIQWKTTLSVLVVFSGWKLALHHSFPAFFSLARSFQVAILVCLSPWTAAPLPVDIYYHREVRLGQPLLLPCRTGVAGDKLEKWTWSKDGMSVNDSQMVCI